MKYIKNLFHFFSAFSILFLTACSEGGLFSSEKDVYYYLPDSTQLKAKRMELASGAVYYVVCVDSVTYEEAYFLQKDSWTLPCLRGYLANDEHRYTSMPTIDALLHFSTLEEEGDIEESRSFSFDRAVLDELLNMSNNMTNGFWTATRAWTRGVPRNYVLRHNAAGKAVSVDAASYDERLSALLLKDARLIEHEVNENQYLVNDTLSLTGARIEGTDGYEYYAISFPDDTVCNWREAMMMEKDGWVLPHTEGEYYKSPVDRERLGEFERPVLHGNGIEPTIEGLCGHHPLYGSKGINPQFFSFFRPGCWLGTPKFSGDAYMVGRFYDDLEHAGSVIEKSKGTRGFVTLVKRIIPQNRDIQYTRKSDGRHVQPMEVVGASGETYYVVDPSGWHDLRFREKDVKRMEDSCWHVMTVYELTDMLGIEQNVTRGTRLQYMQHPLLNNMFTKKNRVYFRDADESMLYFSYSEPDKYGIDKGSFYFNETSASQCAVRLVYTKEEDRLPYATTFHDQNAFGLKGNVRHVTIEDWKATISGDMYFVTDNIDNTKRELAFNSAGLLVKDNYGNSYKYNRKGEFVRGNHDYTALTRNSSGQITEYIDEVTNTDDEGNSRFTFTYDQKGRISKVQYSSWGEGFTETHIYGEDGLEITETTDDYLEGGGGGNTIKHFEYKKFDNKGNWIERIVRITVTEEYDDETTTSENVYTEKREITYADE